MKASHTANTAAADGGDNSTANAGASAGRGTATAESTPLLSTSTGSIDSTQQQQQQQQQTMPPPPTSMATPPMNVPLIPPPGYGTNAGPQSPQYNPYLHPANQAFLQQLQQQQQQQNFQQSPVQFNTTPENQAALAAAAAQYYAAAQAAAHAQQVQGGGGGAGAAGGGVGPSFYPYPFPPMGFQPQQFPPPQQQYQQQQQQQPPPSSPKPPLRGTVSQQPKQKNTASSSSSRRKANNSDIPTNVQITTSASADGSGLPSLQDIFSDQQPQQQQAVSDFGETYMAPLGGSDGSSGDGGGGRGRGYGSMSTGQQQQQQQQSLPPTAVYNAPPPVAGSSAPPRAPSNSRRSKSPHGRFAGRSGGGSSGGILVRTGSSGELKLSADTGASSTLSPKSSKNDRHRRVYSDTPLKGLYGKTRHRRAGSDNVAFAPLPKPSVLGTNDSARARTFSNSSTTSLPKPRHRRGDSASSYLSLVSTGDASMVSHRSNIAQSTMFGGIDAKTGKPLLHFPYEAIRLIMVPSRNGFGATSAKKADIIDTAARRWSTSRNSYTLNKVNSDTMGYGTLSNPEKEAAAAAGELERLYASGDILPTLLTSGHLYAELPENVNELYEEYHRVSEEMELGLLDEWDDHDAIKGNPKNKGVWNGGVGGNSSSNKRPNPLPPANYAMAVDDDVYRRMFSEVSGARTMPCGLFFCGHHEDVAYPSIWIATTLVAALFATLSYLAFYTDSFVDN